MNTIKHIFGCLFFVQKCTENGRLLIYYTWFCKGKHFTTTLILTNREFTGKTEVTFSHDLSDKIVRCQNVIDTDGEDVCNPLNW